MRNAMILTGLWVGIILAAFALVYMDADGPNPGELELLARRAERTYVEPDGRYQFEAPAGWRVEETLDGAYLVGPVEQLEAWITIVDDIGVARAIEIGCEIASPCPGKEFVSFEEEMPPAFAQRKVRIAYETDDEEVGLYGVGFVLLRETIVLVVRGDRTALELRAAELARIEETLAVPAVDAPAVEADS